MRKPFPPPPGFEEAQDRVTDEEMDMLFKSYLRRDQYENKALIKFILAYLECGNAAQASRESGIPSSWRKKPEVHACIEAIRSKAVQKYGYDAHELIERLKAIANFDPINLENPDGSFKTHFSQMDYLTRAAIKEMEVKNIFGEDSNGMRIVIGQIIKIKAYDVIQASELLGTEKNVLRRTTKVEHDITTNMKDLLLGSMKRADERRALTAREVGGEGTGEESGSDESRWEPTPLLERGEGCVRGGSEPVNNE
jgi:Terminase small subunit